MPRRALPTTPLTDSESMFVARNIKMAQAVTNQRAPKITCMDRGEVYSLACLGLCNAVHKHNPKRGRFSTIAYWTMNSTINNALKHMFREMRTPLRLQRLNESQLAGRIHPGFARVDNLDSLARAERFV